jgi:hypothetical protein
LNEPSQCIIYKGINKIIWIYNFISDKPLEFKVWKWVDQISMFEQVLTEFELNSDLKGISNWISYRKLWNCTVQLGLTPSCTQMARQAVAQPARLIGWLCQPKPTYSARCARSPVRDMADSGYPVQPKGKRSTKQGLLAATWEEGWDEWGGRAHHWGGREWKLARWQVEAPRVCSSAACASSGHEATLLHGYRWRAA